ncbi:MAG: Uma2 family endonuclease [Alphaproteobacteria bacterium]|nr:Uma2 family endonuclease [Alphaproteobacteria bacterium]
MDGSHPSAESEIPRRRFSASNVLVMIDAGVFKPDERVELIAGELITMSPQGPLHWDLTYALSRWFMRSMPETLGVAVQGPLRLGEFYEPEPELFVFSAAIGVNEVRGPDVVLLVEISHSSLAYDLKVKAPIYAAHGVREFWVVDVERRRTLVHRLAGDGIYGEAIATPFEEALAAPAGLSLAIADLKPKA